MRWLLVVLAVVVGFSVLSERTSLACMNATMSETEAVRNLKEAEAALEEGDVDTTRELAGEVHYMYRWLAPESPLFVRATRIEALAYVRDRNASDSELARAVDILREVVEPRVERPWPPSPTPVVLADYGEALERAGRNDEAFAVLWPLARKDLIGSAYAYAAFSRAAKAKGDVSFATLAMTRCETIAVKPGTCRGEYPKRPFFRARPIDLALVGVLFLGLGLVRRVRKEQPWSAFRAPMFAAMVGLVGAGAFLLANARHGWAALALVVPLLFFGRAQRAQWMNAVRRGEIPGFTVRRDEEDGAEVLERAIDPSYRESAKAPVLLRIPRSQVSWGRSIVVVLLLTMFFGCVFVLATLRRF
jgi:hypothetical protein